MDPNHTLHHLRLSRAEGVGPLTYRRLLRRFGSAAAAIEALPRLARAGGRTIPPAIPPEEEIAREIQQLEKMGGQFLILGTPAYPPLLALLEDAPPVLALLGDPATLSAPAVAIVGGRNASANGRIMAETLARQVAETVIVVSGLARGIDAAAHQGALQTGRTVAAVAGGLDMPYPPENAALQRRISEAGAVVSETPLGTAPQARHFPRRNRIIAGLSLGVVVVEAAPRSGSLITARLAQEYGREVFAVPGSPLDPPAAAPTTCCARAPAWWKPPRTCWQTCPAPARILHHPPPSPICPASRKIRSRHRNRPPRQPPSWPKPAIKCLNCLDLLRQWLTMSCAAASSPPLPPCRSCWNWSLRDAWKCCQDTGSPW
jgi:DNA protecting protein DprA